MAVGFHNPHPVLGRAIATAQASKSASPLPFNIGVPTGDVGRDSGPLPFNIGVPTGDVNLWGGPLPFVVGKVTEQIAKPRPGGGYGGYVPLELPSRRPSELIERIKREDDDLLELIQIIVSSGLLD